MFNFLNSFWEGSANQKKLTATKVSVDGKFTELLIRYETLFDIKNKISEELNIGIDQIGTKQVKDKSILCFYDRTNKKDAKNNIIYSLCNCLICNGPAFLIKCNIDQDVFGPYTAREVEIMCGFFRIPKADAKVEITETKYELCKPITLEISKVETKIEEANNNNNKNTDDRKNNSVANHTNTYVGDSSLESIIKQAIEKTLEKETKEEIITPTERKTVQLDKKSSKRTSNISDINEENILSTSSKRVRKKRNLDLF